MRALAKRLAGVGKPRS
jgi:NAD(P)-dependent dehydrogenase (short-subunit alcohol dehydrogenase family)